MQEGAKEIKARLLRRGFGEGKGPPPARPQPACRRAHSLLAGAGAAQARTLAASWEGGTSRAGLTRKKP
jgi:hypothetical protein